MCVSEDYETARETARRLGLRHAQVCELAREGMLPAHKLGGQWYLKRGARPGEPEDGTAAATWEYLSVEEAAAALGCSPTTVRTYARRGKLEAVRSPFKAWHVPREAVEAM